MKQREGIAREEVCLGLRCWVQVRPQRGVAGVRVLVRVAGGPQRVKERDTGAKKSLTSSKGKLPYKKETAHAVPKLHWQFEDLDKSDSFLYSRRDQRAYKTWMWIAEDSARACVLSRQLVLKVNPPKGSGQAGKPPTPNV